MQKKFIKIMKRFQSFKTPAVYGSFDKLCFNSRQKGSENRSDLLRERENDYFRRLYLKTTFSNFFLSEVESISHTNCLLDFYLDTRLIYLLVQLSGRFLLTVIQNEVYNERYICVRFNLL